MGDGKAGMRVKTGGSAQTPESYQNLVHLARIALSGRQQDVLRYVQRLARQLRAELPTAAAELTEILHQTPSSGSPLRNAAVPMMPVDPDSRLQLARVEDPPLLDHDPIWDPSVGRPLAQLVQERKRAKELYSAGLHPSRTALFVGPPGVGKTMAARWIARMTNKPLIILDLSAVMSSFLGRTGVNVRHLLDYAKGVECVLLLDEIDAVAKRRDDATEIGELKRLVTVLLQEIDDWPATSLLIAATNHAELLDPALWRRFDAIIEFPKPDSKQVRTAVRTFLSHSSSVDSEVVEALATLFEGQSYSDIERDILRLQRNAILSDRSIVDTLELAFDSRTRGLAARHRLQIAKTLIAGGLSSRRASRLAGVGRDTLRKHDEKDKGKEIGQ